MNQKLNNNEHKIAELEQEILELKEKLKNSISFKYKVGQTLFWLSRGKVYNGEVGSIATHVYGEDEIYKTYKMVVDESINGYTYVEILTEEDLFKTAEQALENLEKINKEPEV